MDNLLSKLLHSTTSQPPHSYKNVYAPADSCTVLLCLHIVLPTDCYMWSPPVQINYYFHICDPKYSFKLAYFVKLWCTALKLYSSNILLPLQVHIIPSKGSVLKCTPSLIPHYVINLWFLLPAFTCIYFLSHIYLVIYFPFMILCVSPSICNKRSQNIEDSPEILQRVWSCSKEEEVHSTTYYWSIRPPLPESHSPLEIRLAIFFRE